MVVSCTTLGALLTSLLTDNNCTTVLDLTDRDNPKEKPQHGTALRNEHRSQNDLSTLGNLNMVTNDEETQTTARQDTPKRCETRMDYAHGHLKRYPYGTSPNGNDTTIYITSASEITPDAWNWMEEGSKPFESCKNLQPWMKCEYHLDAFNDEVSRKSHAILFHAMYMQPQRKQFKGLPHLRSPDQKWIFFVDETPTSVWKFANSSLEFWKLFNLTSTLTSDSNIPLRNHISNCKPKENWRPTGINYAAKKTKMAAWFVSHCESASKREVYVEELKKYIDIDIYGDCGNMSVCNRHAMNSREQWHCMCDLISRDYKFYLGFENSFCSEYITEKFHRPVLDQDVITVVLGAGDYKNVLQEGSIISARDFKSVKDLADHMKKIAKNDTQYNEYIEKVKSHECDISIPFACNLCEYLHNHRYEKQIIYDAAAYWSVEQKCISPIDIYRDIAPEIVSKIHFDKKPEVFL